MHLALGEAESPPADEAESALLGLLRRTMPLTCGQVLAAALAEGAEADPPALERRLAEAVVAAREEGRPVERDLATEEDRRRRLAEALAAAPAHGDALRVLAREHASARQPT